MNRKNQDNNVSEDHEDESSEHHGKNKKKLGQKIQNNIGVNILVSTMGINSNTKLGQEVDSTKQKELKEIKAKIEAEKEKQRKYDEDYKT